MYEIVEGLHRALRIESTWAFVLVVALFFSCAGGLFAWIIDTGYRNSPEYKADHPDPKPQAVAQSDPATRPQLPITSPEVDKPTPVIPPTVQQPKPTSRPIKKPVEYSRDLAEISGFSRDTIMFKLREQASDIRSDWQNYWQIQDLDLDSKEKKLRQFPVPQIDRKQIQDLENQRTELRRQFDADMTDRLRKANPIRAEALSRIPAQLHTEEDEEKRLMFEEMCSGKLHYSEIRGDVKLADYLDELGKRLSEVPKAALAKP